MQLKELAEKVSFSFVRGAKLDRSLMENWQLEAHDYRCTLGYMGLKITVDYFMGPALVNPPECAEVLESLLSDSQAAEGSFLNFCSDFGYDFEDDESEEKIRDAKKIYRSCVNIRKQLDHLLGNDFQEFMQAERLKMGNHRKSKITVKTVHSADLFFDTVEGLREETLFEEIQDLPAVQWQGVDLSFTSGTPASGPYFTISGSSRMHVLNAAEIIAGYLADRDGVIMEQFQQWKK